MDSVPSCMQCFTPCAAASPSPNAVSSSVNPLHIEIPLEETPWGKPQPSGEFSAYSQSVNPVLAAPGQEPTHTHLNGAKAPSKLLPVLVTGTQHPW